jgi:hypothetical protein
VNSETGREESQNAESSKVKAKSPEESQNARSSKLPSEIDSGFHGAGKSSSVKEGDLVACGGLTANHAEMVSRPLEFSPRIRGEKDTKRERTYPFSSSMNSSLVKPA